MTVATFHYRSGRTETRVASHQPTYTILATHGPAWTTMPTTHSDTIASKRMRMRRHYFKARCACYQQEVAERTFEEYMEAGIVGQIMRQANDTGDAPQHAKWEVERSMWGPNYIVKATWFEYFEQDPPRYDLRWYWICIRDDFRERMQLRRDRFRKAFFVRRTTGEPWRWALEAADIGVADRMMEHALAYGYGRMR